MCISDPGGRGHGVAFRDLKDHMDFDAKEWVLGKEYSQAPTGVTCHMSGHSENGGTITHDADQRISWTNRPSVSAMLDTDADGKLVIDEILAWPEHKWQDTGRKPAADLK